MLVFEKDLPKKTDYMKIFDMFCVMARAISQYYIYGLFASGDSKLVLYSIEDPIYDVENCPCGLIYKIKKTEKELDIYIMFIATKYKYRKTGYASLFINEFISYIKNKYSSKFDNIKIVLDSIETAVTFYEHLGFKWTTSERKYDKVFHVHEKREDEHYIMIYTV